MARLAQCDQIAPVMCTTFTQRKFMVDLLSFYEYSTIITLLTKRMLCSILVTDPLPCTAIPAFGILIPAVLFIITVCFLPVLLTISPVCQFRTSGVSTGFLGLTWQSFSPPDKIRALKDLPLKALRHLTFSQ